MTGIFGAAVAEWYNYSHIHFELSTSTRYGTSSFLMTITALSGAIATPCMET
jgi:hypothetical protein